ADVTVVDRLGVAANWTGSAGFTDGRQFLGTPPEKDVGFPYQSTCWGLSNKEVNELMLKLFSWQAFLVEAGKYSDWIDRGRPAPRHGDVGEYLRWVSSKAGLEVKIADIDKLGFDS